MTMTGVQRLPIVVLTALLLACGDAGFPAAQYELRTGVISFYGDPIVITVPSAASVNTPVSVSVRTYGGGCIRKGFVQSQVTNLTATITPLDSFRLPQPLVDCTLELHEYTHQATVQFSQIGSATVSFVGRKQPGDSQLVVQRVIQVQ